MGTVFLQDEFGLWNHHADAAGVVAVPHDVRCKLVLNVAGCADLRPLSALAPGDLQGLELECEGITDASLQYISGLTGLEELTVRPPATIRDAGFVHLRNLTSLNRLVVSGMYENVTGSGLAHIAPLVGLNELRLADNSVNDDSMVHLEYLTDLRWLDISETYVTDHGLSHLSRLARMENLFLELLQVTDDGLRNLKRMKRLRTLALTYSKVTMSGLRLLAGLPLESLAVIGCGLTQADAEELARIFPGLRRLRWRFD